MKVLRKVSAGEWLEVEPRGEGDFVLYEVEPARRFILRRIAIHFPRNTGGELICHFKRGIEKIFPRYGELAGDGTTFRDEMNLELISGEQIKLHYYNRSLSEVKKCFCFIEGDLLE